MPAFAACMDGRAHESEIAAGISEAEALGVHGTPTVFVNGELIRLSTPDQLLALIGQAAP